MARTIRVKDQFPEAYRILSEMDPHALGGKPPIVELYDLQNDPAQLRNLATEPASRPHLDRLMAAFKKWHAETSDSAMILPDAP
jgi:arylsulfatase A-like enzyme